ncbi:uncharacterized protein LOC134192433 [Corticium candelabrum]|uniref:uncharacterized protein LOC134192433 n=1 Tax=Corticium candelabrum TaxID=121492 RepID=UPI002E268782|nr:uncharacterized protein LOC134192433 [Corticium candelabrum]
MHKYAGIVSVCNVISLALIIVGVSTSRWITSDVSGGGESNRGDISFGLFRISYSIRFKEADYREEEDNVTSFYDGVFTLSFYIACVAFIFIALLLTLASLCLAVFNTFDLPKRKLTGPLVMLTLNCGALISGVIGFGLFVAVYLQDMDNVLSMEQQTLFPTFTTDARFGYSFYVLAAGVVMLCGGIALSPFEKKYQQEVHRHDIQRRDREWTPQRDSVIEQLEMISDGLPDMMIFTQCSAFTVQLEKRPVLCTP